MRKFNEKKSIFQPGPLARAKFNALRNKREAIDRFLKKHRKEDLSLYIGNFYYRI